MNSIGIRSSSNIVYYAIASNKNSKTNIKIIDVNTITVPLSFKLPERLRFLRTTFIDIMQADQRQLKMASNDN